MNTLKKFACSVLALGLVMGLTACAPKTFDKQKLIKFLNDRDFEDYDEPEDFYDDFSRIIMGVEGSAYVYCDGKDAQNVYDTVINRFGALPDCDVDETVTLAIADESGSGYGYGCLFVFEDIKDAEEFFEEYGEMYADEGENGSDYYIVCDKITSGKELYCGVYIRENSVFVIRFIGIDSGFVDDLCKVYGVKSPTNA